MSNTSVISEIARGATKYPCRAKNPATCRVHGTFEPLAVITDSAAAKRNLRASELTRANATSFEDRIEAEMLVDKDQLLYDATLEGLSDLNSAKYAARRNVDKLAETRVKNRIAIARKYRAQLLAGAPVLTKIAQRYEDIINLPGAETHAVDDNGNFGQKDLEELSAVPYGTPVVLKLKDGGYIYDHAADGIRGGYDNQNVFTKLLVKPRGFVRARNEYHPTFIHVINSSTALDAKDVESVTVLPTDTKVDPESFVKDIRTLESGQRSSGYRAILGKNSAYIGDMIQKQYSNVDGESGKYWQLDQISVHPAQVSKIVAIPIS